MADFAQMRLGKLPARQDPRTLRLARYLTEEQLPLPLSVDWSKQARQLGMMLNDRIGDCGLAAPAHLIQCMTAENGDEFVPSDAAVERAYRDVGGYVPGQPETDRGVYLLDAMNYWRKTGIDGHKIDGYVALDLKNREHFKRAIHDFGGVILGLSLPESAQAEVEWRLRMSGIAGSPERGSWGGHAVSGHAYRDDPSRPESENGITCVTWGERLRMSWAFLDAYCDEAYAVVSKDWADWDGAPNGLVIGSLLNDLGRLA